MGNNSSRKTIENWLSSGKSWFTDSEFQRQDDSPAALNARLNRLRKQHYIFTPYRGFHVIIPDMYRGFEAIPAEQYIDGLMKYLDANYYVAFLSAALFLGASHQKPMRFQVCTNRQIRNIELSKHQVIFTRNQDVEAAKKISMKTRTGYFQCSDLEQTLYDLIRFPINAGSLNNAATVIYELLEDHDVDFSIFKESRFKINILQRLGHVLDTLDLPNQSVKLKNAVSSRSLSWTPLVRGKSTVGSIKDHNWMVLVNDNVEPDL